MGSSAGSIKVNVPWALPDWGKLDAVNRDFVETELKSIGIYIGDVPPAPPIIVRPGFLWWRSTDNDLYILYDDGTTEQWVAAVATPGTPPIPLPFGETPRLFTFPPNPNLGDEIDIPDAGLYRWDGTVWARLPPYILKTGDTMTGPLTLGGPPFGQQDAVDRQWVEEAVATGNLFRGTWEVANNIPNLNIPPMNPFNGYNWICITQDINVPEQAPAGLPGIGGILIYNGDYVYWSDVNAQYQRVIGGSITKPQADQFYVSVDGDTVNGEIITSIVPTSADAFITKRYVDRELVDKVNKAGDVMTGPLVINNPSTASALQIINGPGFGALDIIDQSNSHSVTITNTAGGLALQVNDNAPIGGDAVHFNNNGDGGTLKLTKSESSGGYAVLALDGGNRNSAGFGGNAQIAFLCPGGGRPQWVGSWTDVGGGTGPGGEGIGFFVNNHGGSAWPTNGLFCGAFNAAGNVGGLGQSGRLILPYGTETTPSLVFGNGPIAGGGFSIDIGTGFFRPTANHVGVTCGGVELCRFGPIGGMQFAYDATGIFFFGGGGIYKRSSQGIVIRQNSSNQPLQVEDNNGTNLRAVLDANSGVRKAGDTMSGDLTMAVGKFVKYSWSTQSDNNDGKIGSRLFGRGLNIIGGATEAGNSNRYVRVWGILEDSNGNAYMTNGTYVPTAGGTMTGELQINRGGNNTGLTLQKNNRTVGVNCPDIYFKSTGGWNNGTLGRINVAHTGNFYTYSDIGQFQFGVGAGGYGYQTLMRNEGSMNIGLWVGTTVSATGWDTRSDLALKMDVTPVHALDVNRAFKELKPIRFRWKAKTVVNELAAPDKISEMPHPEPNRVHWGFAAQDVAKGAPDLVSKDGDGNSQYDLAGVVAILAAKIKQLEERLNGMGKR